MGFNMGVKMGENMHMNMTVSMGITIEVNFGVNNMCESIGLNRDGCKHRCKPGIIEWMNEWIYCSSMGS